MAHFKVKSVVHLNEICASGLSEAGEFCLLEIVGYVQKWSVNLDGLAISLGINRICGYL